MSVISNPSPTKNTHPVVFACDKPGCWWRSAHRDNDSAVIAEMGHPCPYDNLKRSYIMSEKDERGIPYTKPTLGKSLAEKTWDELDSKFELLMMSKEGDRKDIEHYTGWCRALAWTLQKMCSPYYATVEDVTRQAVKRRQMRLGEVEWEPTPGYAYNPPPVGSTAYQKLNTNGGEPMPAAAKKSAPRQPRQPSQPTKPVLSDPVLSDPVLSDKDKQAIESGLQMGMSPEELARILNIPVDTVKKFA